MLPHTRRFFGVICLSQNPHNFRLSFLRQSPFQLSVISSLDISSDIKIDTFHVVLTGNRLKLTTLYSETPVYPDVNLGGKRNDRHTRTDQWCEETRTQKHRHFTSIISTAFLLFFITCDSRILLRTVGYSWVIFADNNSNKSSNKIVRESCVTRALFTTESSRRFVWGPTVQESEKERKRLLTSLYDDKRYVYKMTLRH